MSDMVYCLQLNISDGCSFSIVLEKIYRNRSDAETEMKRIQRIDLELQEWHKANPLQNISAHFEQDKWQYFGNSKYYSISEMAVE
jgi:hypothetical protein